MVVPFLAIFIQVCTNVKNNITLRYTRSFSEENIEYFKFMLLKENWSEMINKTGLDRKSDEFVTIITHYLNNAFPF